MEKKIYEIVAESLCHASIAIAFGRTDAIEILKGLHGDLLQDLSRNDPDFDPAWFNGVCRNWKPLVQEQIDDLVSSGKINQSQAEKLIKDIEGEF